jgi:hypothetical protein
LQIVLVVEVFVHGEKKAMLERAAGDAWLVVMV